MSAATKRRLGAPARALLRDHGISAAQWTKIQFGGDEWFGDACGCNDDRCIGYHHDEQDECGCLPALLTNYYRDQAAIRDGRTVWTTHLQALETGSPADRKDADRKAALWIEHYYRAAMTWSLTETVDGRQGITITNRFNDRRWLVWDAAEATK
ncbi:hypothetical protein SEA_GUSANITA_39 [Arthrobacter phage Gusanita]|nr:hypothetical protein SEA_GUSANITA_39 [Arthrobacter phage Gusanita]